MKLATLLLAAALFSGPGCSKIDREAPSCIKSRIREFELSAESCRSGASVKEYSFQGQKVYVFYPGNCGADMASPVYSENCEYLGLLGGFAGFYKINGLNFDSAAVYRQTIWKN